MGRFLNADVFTSTGQGILGNNMFVYCGNNPVILADSSRCAAKVCIDDGVNILDVPWKSVGGGGGRCISAVHAVNKEKTKFAQIIESIDNYFNNTSEQAVLEGGILTFYRGVPVIKLPIGTDAFSFGAIFIGNGVANRSDSIETIQHEYGHFIHFSLIGMENYIKYVAIPSVIGYHIAPHELYYSQPYEYVADVLGGVQRTYYGNPYPYLPITQAFWDEYVFFSILSP